MRKTTNSSRRRAGSGKREPHVILGAAAFLVTAAQFAHAQGPATATYEPSSRQRLRAEVCMKDEMDHGALCVKRCDEGFKLESSGPKLLCRATKPGAVRKSPGAEYQPPPPVPNAPPPPRGY